MRPFRLNSASDSKCGEEGKQALLGAKPLVRHITVTTGEGTEALETQNSLWTFKRSYRNRAVPHTTFGKVEL